MCGQKSSKSTYSTEPRAMWKNDGRCDKQKHADAVLDEFERKWVEDVARCKPVDVWIREMKEEA